jgi:hypothetical protein
MNPDPPDDLEEIFRATLNQLHAEALVTPTVLTLPPEVIASITSYQKTHRIPREHLLDLALKAQKGRMESLVQACDCLMKDPDLDLFILAFMKTKLEGRVERRLLSRV